MNAELANTSSCATLLGTLLMQSPKGGSVAEATRGLCAMDLENEWPFGKREDLARIAALLEESQSLSPEQLDHEFHHLFVGPQRLDAPPWGSVYLDAESVVFGDSCIELTRWMRANGIALHENESREPADQIGRMLVLLGWICENDPVLADDYLELHLLTWAPRYFERLEKAAGNPFYRALAKLSNLTLADIAAQRGLPIEPVHREADAL